MNKFLGKINKLLEQIAAKIISLNKPSSDIQIGHLEEHVKPGIRFGLYIAGVFVLFFIIWGGLAPIDSAVIAHGTIVPKGNSKIVQHLQGGIIEKIIAHEGQMVKIGDPLIELSKTQAKSRLQMLLNQYYSRKINEARISAEHDSNEDIIISPDIKNAIKEYNLEKIFESEISLLKFNLSSFKGQLDLYDQQIVLTNDLIKGIVEQIESANRQKSLIQEELTSVNILLAKQLVQKTRVLSLERAKAEIDGRLSDLNSQINRAKDSINEIKLKAEQLKQNRKRELATELKEINNQLAGLKEEIDAAQDIEKRTIITAQDEGVISNLHYHSVGGVIAPGSPIMEIVPISENLQIEARIMPQDIDVVHENQSAKILLSAFKVRFMPRVNGTVTYVAADKTMDEKTGQPFFLARVSIDFDEVKKLGKTLLPGMPAEVFIVTGEHTFLEYFLSPIINSFRHSFHEE